MKKYIAKQDTAATKKQLQGQLDRFVAYYNTVRPHRGIGRRTPLEAFEASVKSYPRGPKVDCAGYRVRRDKVDKSGSITIRYQARMHHVGVGRRFAGQRVVVLMAGRDVRVLTPDGHPLRHFKLDPSRDYQPQP